MAGRITLSLKNTVFSQTDNTPSYVLRAAVVSAEGGIDPNIFVYQIAQDGVSDDTFLRVASLQDVNTYLAGKASAETRGDDVYRVSNATIEYDNSDVALQAKLAVQEAVDKYVADYNDFDGFGTAEEVVVLSGVNPTFLENLKTDYYSVKAEVEALEASEISIQSEIDQISDTVTIQKDRVRGLDLARTNTRSIASQFYNQTITQYDTIAAYGELTSPHLTEVNGFRANAATQLSGIDSVLAAIDTVISDERVLEASYYQDLEAKNQEQLQVNAQLLAKRRQLDGLLSSILQLEPTFV